VEVLLAPERSPLNIMEKVSYWSRIVMVPMLVLQALRPKPARPCASIRELFVNPPEREKYALQNPTGHWLGDVMLALDRVGRYFERAVGPGGLDPDRGHAAQPLQAQCGTARAARVGPGPREGVRGERRGRGEAKG